MSKYWQIAAGDKDRNFVDICLKYDVILNGPGRFGEWNENEEYLKKYIDEGFSNKKLGDLRRFCKELEDGDIVVLRLGTDQVHGVGKVVGDYTHQDCFADVDGWDLQHCRRVNWMWKANFDKKKKDYIPHTFEAYTMKFGDTTQVINNSEKTKILLDWLNEKLGKSKIKQELEYLPSISKELETQDISKILYDYGIGTNSISDLKDRIEDMSALARWYRTYGMPSEAETVTHLVVPLLKSLGWTNQKIALEQNVSTVGRIDIALFEYGNRKEEYLSAVIEVKKFDQSVMKARKQGDSYAEKFDNCCRLILTDGIRYAVYKRDFGKEEFGQPYAYLNLLNLRNGNPIYGECKGADKAMLTMSSDWRPDFEDPSQVKHNEYGKDV